MNKIVQIVGDRLKDSRQLSPTVADSVYTVRRDSFVVSAVWIVH